MATTEELVAGVLPRLPPDGRISGESAHLLWELAEVIVSLRESFQTADGMTDWTDRNPRTPRSRQAGTRGVVLSSARRIARAHTVDLLVVGLIAFVTCIVRDVGSVACHGCGRVSVYRLSREWRAAPKLGRPVPLLSTAAIPGYGPHLDRDNDGIGCG